METLDLVQGEQNWHEHRFTHDNASEAAAMLGLDKNIKRDELIRICATGDEQEFSDYVKGIIFKDGHATEASARLIIEGEIGEDLYPVTGVDGRLSASFDGLTLFEDTSFEHKQWNKDLAESVAQGIVPDTHMPQLQQQLMISTAEKNIFVVSDGTKEKREKIEVLPDPVWFKRIRAGWVQFHKDVDDYTPVEVVAEVAATPSASLPAITYKMDGLSLTSNLNEYKIAAEKLVEDSQKKIETDQDFADRDLLNKTFKGAEERIKLMREQVLGEVDDIATFTRELGDIGELIRQARLNGEKQVKARKKAIRDEILTESKTVFNAHWQKLNDRVKYMPVIQADFAAVMKGKKLVSAIRSACNDLLASLKIEANEVADNIDCNFKALEEVSIGKYGFLFPDIQEIITKPNDDLMNLAIRRISDHKKAEHARFERIRHEEQEKAEQKARDNAAQAERERVAAVKTTNAPVVEEKQPEQPQAQPEPAKEQAPANAVTMPSKQPTQIQSMPSLLGEVEAWCDEQGTSSPDASKLRAIIERYMPEQMSRKA